MDISRNQQFNIPPDYVLFIEGDAFPQINQTIREDYLSINNEFKRGDGKLLLYPEGILSHTEYIKEEYSKVLRYHYPQFSKHQVTSEINGFFNLVREIKNRRLDINKYTRHTLNLPNNDGLPYFVTNTHNGNRYHYYNPALNVREWAFKIANLWRDETFFNIDEPPEEPKQYDPDKDFTYMQISREAEKAIKQLGKVKAYGLMVNLFGLLAKECGIGEREIANLTAQSPKMAHFLNPDNKTESRPLSRLMIDNQHRIILPEYNHLEIKMPTLSKVVYFLFLRYPEGLLFKELIDYRHEIFHLYNRVTNRSNMEEMVKSVDALLNPTSNSINEKCSRIKEAFVSVMEDNLAKHYYITGDRGKPKRITLPQHMVETPWK